MPLIKTNIKVNPRCGGAFVRWYYNGWQYWLFNERYEITDHAETLGIQAIERFSHISKIEEPTGKRIVKRILLGRQGLTGKEFKAIKNILQSETVEMWINGLWFTIEVNRDAYTVRRQQVDAFDVIFQAVIKDAPVLEQRLAYKRPSEIVDPTVPANITLETLAGSAGQVSISVTGGFNIQIVGDTSIVEYGMEYRTTGIPWTKQVKGGTLLWFYFPAAITGLTPNTTYQYRAYVKDNFNYYYGDTKMITTQVGVVTLNYGSQVPTLYPPHPNRTDYNRHIGMSGLPLGVSINIELTVTYAGSDLEAYAYFRKNGGAWVEVAYFMVNGSEDVVIPVTGGFVSGDAVDFRLMMHQELPIGDGTMTAEITGGNVVSGSADIVVGTQNMFTIARP